MVKGNSDNRFNRYDMNNMDIRRVKYSTTHLRAAAMFSRLCGKAEQDHIGEANGGFFKDIIGYTVESIILSVASPEAYINEFITCPEEYLPDLDDDKKHRISVLIEDNISSLEKYQKSLSIIQNGEVLNQKQYPIHDMIILRKLKNALVHFYPEWQGNDTEYGELEKSLDRIKFKPSPFYQEGTPVFPFRYMSYGCTQWAVKSAYDFMELFSRRAGIPFNLSAIKDMFNTEIPHTPLSTREENS